MNLVNSDIPIAREVEEKEKLKTMLNWRKLFFAKFPYTWKTGSS